jgi:hypothetical protein
LENPVSRTGAQSVKGWGLLANGSSGSWSIDIDETHDGDAWNMQIDGPQVYLGFALSDLQAITNLYGYLLAGLQPDQANGKRYSNGITMGKLGSMTVRIIQDDEFATRWFIVINGKADAVVRFTLDAADAEMLADALKQVIEDLPR